VLTSEGGGISHVGDDDVHVTHLKIVVDIGRVGFVAQARGEVPAGGVRERGLNFQHQRRR
jgi:hypothetical protein